MAGLGLSAHIPNFDTFSDDEKIEFLLKMTSMKEDQLRQLSAEDLDAEFKKAVSKEVQDLEKDVIDAFS